ncbi:hypothetical protein NQ317_016181 [Molorchus minor]|uniref:HTH psq-type domain-containing protein n=1 Tax=Molorchus minor TaxID=1323400 RepID=A0ABQ9JBD0_9CUCU|nr:hypothetical protein NQ317_016181 [Molorchus minor]
MPKVRDGSKYLKKYDETTISKALDDILNNDISKKAASKKYKIPRSTLQFRLGQKFTKTTLGPNPVLSKEEEEILVNWILESHRKGFPRRKEDLQISAMDGTKPFLKRHNFLTERVPEAVTAASSRVSENDMRKWFLHIETYLKDENYFDILKETCFLLCPKNKTVIAPKGSRNVYEVDNAPAKSNLTVLFTFSAQGEVTPPFIIYPYKRLPASIASSVPDQWGIGTSPNGWMKTELFFEYIANVLHSYLINKNIKFPIILFVDGHSTHTSYQLSDLCSQ